MPRGLRPVQPRGVGVEQLSDTSLRLSLEDAKTRVFPQVCAKTGRETNRTYLLYAQKTPIWAYFTLLLGFLVGLLVILVIRASQPNVRMTIPASKTVTQRRAIYSAMALLFLLVGPVTFVIGAVAPEPWVIFFGLVMFAAGVVLVVATQRQIVSSKIKDRAVVLGGLHPAFVEAVLDQTPEEAHPEFVNDSGTGAAAVLPPELRGFNFGAFFLTPFWGVRNRVYAALATLLPIPIVNIILCFYFGGKGSELAWQRKRWDSKEAFEKTQRRWGVAGILLAGVALVASFFIAAAIDEPGVDRPGTRAFVPASSTESFVAPDGSVSVKAPSNFATDPTLHPDATLQISNRADELYLIAFVEPKNAIASTATLEVIAELGREDLATSLEGSRTSTVQTRQIGGMRAVSAEVVGSIDGLEIAYVHTVIETPSRFLEVTAWTLADDFSVKKSTLTEMIDSVREKPPGDQTA